jgi:hydroxymethylpyrimidine pyrophosphatase-like HAD family hydrolase
MGAEPEKAADLIASIRHPITKILAAAEPPLPTELAPLARAHFAGRAAVTISHPRFLEFTAPGVSKGRAIRWLARRLRIPLGAVLAIGDQWNDIEMLAEVGHGTAMPSAPDEVLAVARYVAPPVGDEGVARMIEALVLATPERVAAASVRFKQEAEAARRSRAATSASAGAVAGAVAGAMPGAMPETDSKVPA